MSNQLKAAMIRGIVIAVPTAALTTLTTWSQTDNGKAIAIAGLTSLIGTFLARSGLEGTYDTRRDRSGDVHAGDVGTHEAAPAAVPVTQ